MLDSIVTSRSSLPKVVSTRWSMPSRPSTRRIWRRSQWRASIPPASQSRSASRLVCGDDFQYFILKKLANKWFKDKLIVSDSVTSVFQLTPTIGCAMIGMVPDSKFQVQSFPLVPCHHVHSSSLYCPGASCYSGGDSVAIQARSQYARWAVGQENGRPQSVLHSERRDEIPRMRFVFLIRWKFIPFFPNYYYAFLLHILKLSSIYTFILNLNVDKMTIV